MSYTSVKVPGFHSQQQGAYDWSHFSGCTTQDTKAATIALHTPAVFFNQTPSAKIRLLIINRVGISSLVEVRGMVLQKLILLSLGAV